MGTRGDAQETRDDAFVEEARRIFGSPSDFPSAMAFRQLVEVLKRGEKPPTWALRRIRDRSIAISVQIGEMTRRSPRNERTRKHTLVLTAVIAAALTSVVALQFRFADQIMAMAYRWGSALGTVIVVTLAVATFTTLFLGVPAIYSIVREGWRLSLPSRWSPKEKRKHEAAARALRQVRSEAGIFMIGTARTMSFADRQRVIEALWPRLDIERVVHIAQLSMSGDVAAKSIELVANYGADDYLRLELVRILAASLYERPYP